MQPARPASGSDAGFTLIELLVTITIFSILLAVGIPNASAWLLANRARGASAFYAEGFNMARRQAVAHNTFSRISLSPNGTSGQMDWQVDLCFVGAGTACGPGDPGWSTPSDVASNDPLGDSGYRSVFRAATLLPTTEVLTPTLAPDGATQVYYTALGWVDTNAGPGLTQLRLDPTSKYANDVPAVALRITLAGMATQCNPLLASSDSRACPP
jgi:type IV fimbrial biogenesis protein FimT